MRGGTERARTRAAVGARILTRAFDDALKVHEDKVTEVIGGLGEAERAIAYKYRHAGGMRIATADHELRKAIRRERGDKRG